jgi:hypothetical protein
MRPLKLSVFGTLAIASTLAAGACMPHAANGGDLPGDPGYNNNNPNNPTQPGVAKYSGVYQANAPIDFTQNGVLPGIASPALNALTMVGSNPGRALVEMAQTSGAINLSSSLRNILGDIITGQLDNIFPIDVQNDLNILAGIAKITQSTVIKNSLTIHTPRADNTMQVDIQITGASFDFVDINGYAQHIDVTTPAVNAATSKSSMTMATLVPRPDAPVADADITLTGGTLSVPLGGFLAQAIGPLVLQPTFGVSDLAGALNKIMQGPCQTFGNYIYQACQGTSILEDIQPSVYTGICTAAVSLAAIEMVNEINKLTVDGVRITNGRAVLYDVSQSKPSMDHQSDRIADGMWQWNFGSIVVPSTLSGERIGNAL